MRRGKHGRNNEQETSQAYVPQWLVSSWLGVVSVALALTICIATRLLPKWGQWYSINPALRRQTEAMLHGSLALDDDPRTLGYDMAWTDSGVQQV